MLEKLKQVESRYSEIEAKLADPAWYSDSDALRELYREQRELQEIVETYRAYLRAEKDLEQAKALLSDPELGEMAREEYSLAKDRLEKLEQSLRVLLLPKDPNDEKNVILEIRSGVGGEESALFAHSLFRMYSMYAEKRGWKIEIANLNETELGGVREVIAIVEGAGAYSRLKFESAGSTPAPSRSQCCRSWTRSLFSLIRRICRSTHSAPAEPVVSMSTKRRARFASRIFPPVPLWSVRMREASIRIKTVP